MMALLSHWVRRVEGSTYMASEGRSPLAAAASVPPNGDGPAVRRAQPNKKEPLERARSLDRGPPHVCRQPPVVFSPARDEHPLRSLSCVSIIVCPGCGDAHAGWRAPGPGWRVPRRLPRERPTTRRRSSCRGRFGVGWAMKGAVERRPTRGTLLVRGPVRAPAYRIVDKLQAADLVQGHVSGGGLTAHYARGRAGSMVALMRLA
jgi:hypothetical protein